MVHNSELSLRNYFWGSIDLQLKSNEGGGYYMVSDSKEGKWEAWQGRGEYAEVTLSPFNWWHAHILEPEKLVGHQIIHIKVPDSQIEEPLSGEHLRGKEKPAVRKTENQAKGKLEGDNFTGRQNCTVPNSLFYNLTRCMTLGKLSNLSESQSPHL